MAAIALVIMVGSEVSSLDNDLQLIAPAHASQGELLPLRGLVYGELQSIEGAKLSARAVDVELVSGMLGDHVLARTKLARSRAGTNDVEGLLAVPKDASGQARLRAHLRIGREELQVIAPLTIDAHAKGVDTEPRALRVLQQLTERNIQRMPFGPPLPSALHVRVGGGACVPEEPCTLFVHVGEPPSGVEIEPTPALTVRSSTKPGVASKPAAPRPAIPLPFLKPLTPVPSDGTQPVYHRPEPPAEPPTILPVTSGVIAFEVVAHGPEAEPWLRVTRNGPSTVARRAVRLPIALGSAALTIKMPRLDAPAKPTISRGGDMGGCIVDAFTFHEGRWVWSRTGSLEDCSQPSETPFALPAGIHRLQLRSDPFGSATAAVGVVYVRAPNETRPQLLVTLANAARSVAPADALVASVLAHAGELDAAELDVTCGYLSAILESGVVPQPRAATGYAEARAKLKATQGQLRMLAIFALVLGGIGLAFGIGRRGMAAGERASALMVDAGQDPSAAQRARMRTMIATVASALALLLVFVVLAVYVVVRGNALG